MRQSDININLSGEEGRGVWEAGITINININKNCVHLMGRGGGGGGGGVCWRGWSHS